jgi:hypothetical protein
MNPLAARPEYDHIFCNSEMTYRARGMAFQLIRVWPSSQHPGYWHCDRTSAKGLESFKRPARKAFVAYVLSEHWHVPPTPAQWMADLAEEDALKQLPQHRSKLPLVYFLKAGPFVKIGFTAGPPQARIADLKTGCPYEIELIGTVPGPQKLESELHRRFAVHRASREWFHAHSDILQYVRERKST